MKLFAGWVVSAGAVLVAGAAQAQMSAPHMAASPSYIAVSDVGGPYAAMPPEAGGPRYGYGPTLLPPIEVYTVVRENGFSPLGIPRQRGFFYTIAVINRGGDSGRLVIDARDGRIVRFLPGDRIGDNLNDDLSSSTGPAGVPAPQPARARGVPRPPALVPHVASRTVPVPRPNPLPANPAAEPTQQAAVAAPKPADAQASMPPAEATVGQVKPAAPAILPTQEMPKVQGLD